MINTNKENPVADHFNEEEHTENRLDFKINVVGQEQNKNRRLRLEEAWMLLLNTHHPNGLNSKWQQQKIKKIKEIPGTKSQYKLNWNQNLGENNQKITLKVIGKF